MSNDVLHKYVCMNPYKYIDLQTDNAWICCPSWAPTMFSDYKYNNSEITLEDDWRHGIIDDIRLSVADGSYRHCDHTICPKLNKLINTGEHPGYPFITREEFDELLEGQQLEVFVEEYDAGPEEIVWGFDRACNLRCPSCRDELVVNDREDTPIQIKRRKIVDIINNDFSKSVVRMLITGSGDPFYSRIFRDFLKEFDSSRFPNLDLIQIITNGVLLNEKMWMSLNARPYIKAIEFSVDAGTQHTYENVTRLGGDWQKLLENVEYLASQPEPRTLIFSMVVSQLNYMEMLNFYQTFSSILERVGYEGNVSYNYRRHVFWQQGVYSEEDLRNISVFDPVHPHHSKFLDHLEQIRHLPNVSHNFHEVLQ